MVSKPLSKFKSIFEIDNLISEVKLKLFSNIVSKYTLFTINFAVTTIFLLISMAISLFLVLAILQALNKIFAIFLNIKIRKLSIKSSYFQKVRDLGKKLKYLWDNQEIDKKVDIKDSGNEKFEGKLEGNIGNILSY